MSVLADEQVKTMAKKTAEAHGVPVKDITPARTIGFSGESALEIKYTLPPGSEQSIMGMPRSATVSQVIMEMADDDG